ncbi:MAG TPA: ferredoxin [Chthoniobacteraceae bacterium]|nr:ferredoxin [Chthoniobacteraceae bacterium]
MATITDRTSINAAGAYYVDSTCTDCSLCRDTAGDFFARDEDSGLSYVSRQPVTPEEIALVEEALIACPTESIGNDAAAN